MRFSCASNAFGPPRLIASVGQRNMKHTQDHFSAIAPQYALGRIAYPEDLYRFLVAQCHGQDLAWDCATGSGQAALDLVRTFSRVIATDISKELLALAPPHPRIFYHEVSAEESGIEPESVDLITVAQALHWFDLSRFWPEVMRVLKKGGVLAFWGYNWPVVEPGVDRVLEDFKSVISSSWPERSAACMEVIIRYARRLRKFLVLPLRRPRSGSWTTIWHTYAHGRRPVIMESAPAKMSRNSFSQLSLTHGAMVELL